MQFILTACEILAVWAVNNGRREPKSSSHDVPQVLQYLNRSISPCLPLAHVFHVSPLAHVLL